MNEFARKELLTMIQQLLMEADLTGELEAFLASSDTSFAGIQVLLYFYFNFKEPLKNYNYFKFKLFLFQF
jgi:hypothetical protein